MIKLYDFTVINEPLKRFYLALSDTTPTVVNLYCPVDSTFADSKSAAP